VYPQGPLRPAVSIVCKFFRFSDCGFYVRAGAAIARWKRPMTSTTADTMAVFMVNSRVGRGWDARANTHPKFIREMLVLPLRATR
jgi:hypothetical protein